MIKRTKLILLTAALAAVSSSIAAADSSVPANPCKRPYRPPDLSNPLVQKRWKDDVQKYRTCVVDFTAEQKAESENHGKAATDAIAEWNAFATTL